MPEKQIKAQAYIERIYLRKFEFSPGNMPELFELKWHPKVHLQLDASNTQLGDNRYEVVLKVHLTAKIGSHEACEFKVEQAGIFTIQDSDAVDQILTVTCPNILFPYIREAIDSVAVKATLPPFTIAPLDFQTVIQEAMEQQMPWPSQTSKPVLN